jgi:hypothetical protein
MSCSFPVVPRSLPRTRARARFPAGPIRRGLRADSGSELGWPGFAIEARCTTKDRTRQAVVGELHAREVPLLDALAEPPAGRYAVGEPGEERAVVLRRVLVGRWPVVNAHLKPFAAATGRRIAGRSRPSRTIRSSPIIPRPTAPGPTPRRSSQWASLRLGRRVRLPSADE